MCVLVTSRLRTMVKFKYSSIRFAALQMHTEIQVIRVLASKQLRSLLKYQIRMNVPERSVSNVKLSPYILKREKWDSKNAMQSIETSLVA